MIYLFELGRQPEISTAEIEAVFERLHINSKTVKHTNKYLIVEIIDDIDSQQLIEILGGTIKIAQKIKSVGDPIKSIVHFLHDNTSGKIHFSVSGNASKKTGLAIKKELKNLGHSVRYVEVKNTASILHNNLVEKHGDFTIIDNDIFVTTAIQDIESFSKRDYDRPGSDNKSGMLPPKLARIMINLTGADPKKDVLLDPFCGSGTVLTEALSLRFQNLIGSDISDKAIDDSEKNLTWMKNNFSLPTSHFQLHHIDASKLATVIKQNSVDTIVSEPFMGKPLYGNEPQSYLAQQARELGDLFVDAFTQFHKILKPGGVAIFIIPKFKTNNGWVSIDCLDNIKKIGFEIIPFDSDDRRSTCLPGRQANNDQKSLLYVREGQHVGREIWKFKKM